MRFPTKPFSAEPESMCPERICDGSGFVVDSDRTARPCLCRAHDIEARRRRRHGRAMPQQWRGMSLMRIPPHEVSTESLRVVGAYINQLSDAMREGRHLWICHPLPLRVKRDDPGIPEVPEDLDPTPLTAAETAEQEEEQLWRDAVVTELPRHSASLLAAVCERAFQQGTPYYAISHRDLLISLAVRARRRDGSYGVLLERLAAVDLLAVWDFAAPHADWASATEDRASWAREQTELVLRDRYEQCRSTVVASTIAIDDQEKVVGPRIHSLVLRMCGEPVIATPDFAIPVT